jgi:hypothetical protein
MYKRAIYISYKRQHCKVKIPKNLVYIHPLQDSNQDLSVSEMAISYVQHTYIHRYAQLDGVLLVYFSSCGIKPLQMSIYISDQEFNYREINQM